LTAALSALGLNVPANANDKPVYVEIDNGLYWVNKDNRGGVWINGREKREGVPKPDSETEGSAANASTANTEPFEGPPPSPTSSPVDTLVPSSEVTPAPAVVPDTSPSEATTPAAEPASTEPAAATDAVLASAEVKTEPEIEASESAEPAAEASADNNELPETGAPFEPANPSISANPTLAAARPLLKATKRGGNYSGEVGEIARALEKNQDEFLSSLIGAGLIVPADADEKPAYLDQEGETFWLTKNAADGSLWLNARGAKPVRRSSGTARPRAPRKPKPEEPSEPS
jgi:hypothetical protein